MRKVAVITGGSRGLGRACVLKFAEAGWQVFFFYRENTAAARKTLSLAPDARAFKCDVRDAEAVAGKAREIMKMCQGVDVLINSAGVREDELILRMSEKQWEDVVDVSLKGAFNCIRAFAPFMHKGGHVLNISSFAALVGRVGQANYVAAKSALIGLTKSASFELARCGVLVNAIIPPVMDTDMTRNLTEEKKEELLKDALIKEIVQPKDVAEAIFRFTQLKYITGQVIVLDSRICG